MKLYVFPLAFVFAVFHVQAQDRKKRAELQSDTAGRALNEVVVTGEYQPQSLKKSVYRTRVISAERIRLRAAGNLQQVLSTELGFRFSNDLTLGTSDVQLMGMSGRNVKILLDGVPMVDRGDTRESLNQVDIHTIERIEIVDGPLAVSYGSDALAGVVNIITRRAGPASLEINARVQEETAGKEYAPFGSKGNHLQHAGLSWRRSRWSALAGLTHTDAGGYRVPAALDDATAIAAVPNRWKPKTQWLANTKIGYQHDHVNIWYRLDYAGETIDSKGAYNPSNYKAANQQYITHRYTHQLQGEYKLNTRLQLSGVLAYTDLQRRTETRIHDYSKGTEELSAAAGEQDVSTFHSALFRSTAQYLLSPAVSFQPGVEISMDEAGGARIKGKPGINDYAFFISSELKPVSWITFRPGVRLIHNSVYDAPVIPSLNTRISLDKQLDLRLSYASGFRAPSLRELYYDFIDASHTILGNEHLKAEQSNNYSASLSFSGPETAGPQWRTVLSGFYNHFKNRISYAQSAADAAVTTLINIDKYKTTGATLEQHLSWKNLSASLGFSWIGTYNAYSAETSLYGNSPEFVWSPEISSNLTWHMEKAGTAVNLAFKFSGKKPLYELYTTEDADQQVRLAKTGAFSIADLNVNKQLPAGFTLNAGINNLFNITTLNNSSLAGSTAHSAGSGPVPVSYGRSCVLGLSYNWNRK